MPRGASYGYSRETLVFDIPLVGVLDQAGAVTFILNWVVGFTATLEACRYVAGVVGVGAGATQALVVRKGGATGTALFTVTPTLANSTLGAVLTSASTPLETDATFSDTDTLTITKTAGTVFSAGGGRLYLRFRMKSQRAR